MNQRQLVYFLEVYKRNSITQAAESLFISPQAISKTIASLESELGVSLFTHKSNRIIPTNEAAKLASHAKNIIDEFDIVENKLFCNIDTQKILPLSCSYDIPQLLSADFFHKLHINYPRIRIQLKEFPDAHILKQLERSEVELGIFSSSLNPQKYVMEPLFSEPFCLVVNKNHPLANKECISLTDLNNVNIVIKDVSSYTSESQYSSFLQEGASPKIILETTDSHLIHQMAENNYAVGMTLSFLAKKIVSNNIVIIPFKHKWFKKTLYLIHKNDFILSQEAQILKKELLLEVKKQLL